MNDLLGEEKNGLWLDIKGKDYVYVIKELIEECI